MVSRDLQVTWGDTFLEHPVLKDIDDLFNLRILAKDMLLWKEYYDKV